MWCSVTKPCAQNPEIKPIHVATTVSRDALSVVTKTSITLNCSVSEKEKQTCAPQGETFADHCMTDAIENIIKRLSRNVKESGTVIFDPHTESD